MDYLAIKLFHLLGIMLIFMGLSGMAFGAYAGFGPYKKQIRRATAILHGVGLLLLIGSGFAMLSRLNMLHGDPPNWVKVKLVIWLLLGGLISLAARWTRGIWIQIVIWIALGGFAAYLGLFKPF